MLPVHSQVLIGIKKTHKGIHILQEVNEANLEATVFHIWQPEALKGGKVHLLHTNDVWLHGRLFIKQLLPQVDVHKLYRMHGNGRGTH